MQTHIAVIGGGPGGYVAAIRAAQLGAKVTLIEKEHLGGTCLNVGCIPTKALLHTAAAVRHIKEGEKIGIHATVNEINWKEVLSFKESVVGKLVGGVGGLLKANKIAVINGEAAFIKPKTVEITDKDGNKQTLVADKFILATGSVPVMPPIEGLRESKYVIDSTGALNLDDIPKSMIIIGGGVIGIEMACVLNTFGTKVTIVEALPRLCPSLDGEMAQRLGEELKEQGIEIMLENKVMAVKDQKDGAQVTVQNDGKDVTLKAEKVLCAVGRRAFTDTLSAEKVGIKTERGKILVNEYLETNIPGIYAIGDCVGQIMLAHTASAQGEVAAENATGEKNKYNPACVPSGIYSFPELASVGLTEEQVKEKGIAYHVGKFPLTANGRALIENGGKGLVKIIAGDEFNEVLGVHILAPQAMEMVAEGAMAISLEATTEEIINAIHAHPTVNEAVREAALFSEGRAIHTVNKKK